MKKLILLLLFIPLVSFGQVITNKEYGQIDLRTIEDKYIEIGLEKSWWPRGHIFNSSKYKKVILRTSVNQKRWNVFEDGNPIILEDKVDVLNFFYKYGFDLVESSEEIVGSGGTIINIGPTSQYFGGTETKETLLFININFN